MHLLWLKGQINIFFPLIGRILTTWDNKLRNEGKIQKIWLQKFWIDQKCFGLNEEWGLGLQPSSITLSVGPNYRRHHLRPHISQFFLFFIIYLFIYLFLTPIKELDIKFPLHKCVVSLCCNSWINRKNGDKSKLL